MENYQNTQIEDLPNEIWKPVNGLEEFYQVSNLGRVKSIQGSSRLNDKILTQAPNTKDGKGYLQVSFRRGLDKLYRVCVHRLVAESFIENDDPFNKRVVNHKDENKLNNEVSNLEWCSQKYNHNYSFNLHRKERIEKLRNAIRTLPKDSLSFAPWWHKGEVQKRSWECPGEGWERGNSKSIKDLHATRLSEYNKDRNSKQVLQIDKETNEVVAKYESATEAAKAIGRDKSSITSCCRGKSKTCANYKWRYDVSE